MKDASKPKAMDSRESLHVASLGKANFSGYNIGSSASYRKDVIPLGY